MKPSEFTDTSHVMMPLQIAVSEGLTNDHDDRVHSGIPSRPPTSISILPYELLSAIFLTNHFGSIRLSHSVALVISSVNRLWRGVALSIPKLWRRIYCSRKTTLAEVQTYAMRSGCLPLDVHIDIGKKHRLRHRSSDKAIRRTLLSYLSPRLRHLKIGGTWWGCLSRVLGCPQIDAPLLRSLDISYMDQNAHGIISASKNIFRETPKLQSLRLSGILLEHCKPLLTTVTHLIIRWRLQLGASPVIVRLPSLQFLHIERLYDRQFLRLVRTLSAPSLRTIAIKDLRFEVGLQGVPPTNFPNLRTLILGNIRNHRRETWRNLGDIFPTIVHLVQYDGLHQNFLRYLRPRVERSAPFIWPRLQSVAVMKRAESGDNLYTISISNGGSPVICLPRGSILLLRHADLLDKLRIMVTHDFDDDFCDAQYLLDQFSSGFID